MFHPFDWKHRWTTLDRQHNLIIFLYDDSTCRFSESILEVLILFAYYGFRWYQIKSKRWASWTYRRKSQLFDLKTILGRLYFCQDCITFLTSSCRHKWLSLTTEITWSLIIHDQTWYLLNSLFNSISLNLNELAPFLLVSKSNISLLLIQKV